MSADSFAVFRKSRSENLEKLVEEHLQRDLRPKDHETLQSAARKISTHATVGSLLGLGLGLFLAYRIRSNRVKLFEAFKTTQKPTHVKFVDGREEPIPDLTPYLQPMRLGDFVTYTFFSIAGMFLGGETGLLTGVSNARRTISRVDPETRERIGRAFRGFRVDMLKREIEMLEKGMEPGKGEMAANAIVG